jgi:hypothetical protein
MYAATAAANFSTAAAIILPREEGRFGFEPTIAVLSRLLSIAPPELEGRVAPGYHRRISAPNWTGKNFKKVVK